MLGIVLGPVYGYSGDSVRVVNHTVGALVEDDVQGC